MLARENDNKSENIPTQDLFESRVVSWSGGAAAAVAVSTDGALTSTRGTHSSRLVSRRTHRRNLHRPFLRIC
jgi:hypothetical protein